MLFIKVELSVVNLRIFNEVFDLVRKIYQHELCNDDLRSYIRFECGKLLNSEIDVKRFLNQEVDKDASPILYRK